MFACHEKVFSVVLLCIVRSPLVLAQVVQFQDALVPPNSIITFNTFFVYGTSDSPGGHKAIPSVSLKDITLQVKLDESPEVMLKDRTNLNVHVGIAPYKLIEDHGVEWCLPDSQRYMERMAIAPLTGQYGRSWNVTESNIYTLYVSNCVKAEMLVSGTVTVKNAYGYLPGSDYPKLSFYLGLTIAYLALGLVWGALSYRWWQDLFNIQHCISGAIAFSFFESALFYGFFSQWNVVGVRPKPLLVIAILVSVLKTTFSYMLLVAASLGWGITQATLDRSTKLKIILTYTVYFVADFIREIVVAFWQSSSLSASFMLLCALPVSVLNGSTFYWITMALSSLTTDLKAQNQIEKLKLFNRFSVILAVGLVCTIVMLVFTIYDVSHHIHTRWKYQWMETDGMSHALFLLVLIAMMILWAPHKDSHRYCYSMQLATQETEIPSVVVGHSDLSALPQSDAEEEEG